MRAVPIMVTLAAMALVTLHVLRPDLDPRHRFVSEYAVDTQGSSSGWAMQAVFLLLGATAASLGRALMRSQALSRKDHIPASWLLYAAAAGSVSMFVFRTDLNALPVIETTTGKIHDISSVVTFLFALAVMALVAVRGTIRSPVLVILFCIAVAAMLVQSGLMILRPRPYLWVGLTERIVIGALLLWSLLLARFLHCAPFHKHGVAASTAGSADRG